MHRLRFPSFIAPYLTALFLAVILGTLMIQPNQTHSMPYGLYLRLPAIGELHEGDLVQVESPVMRVAVRIALLPVIAGISYEVLKAAGNSDNPVIRLLSMPGLGIQRLTTKEPDDGMIECAIRAMELVIPEEKGADAW